MATNIQSLFIAAMGRLRAVARRWDGRWSVALSLVLTLVLVVLWCVWRAA